VASLSQGRTAAAQCGLFTYKSVPVIFEPPCINNYFPQEIKTDLFPKVRSYKTLSRKFKFVWSNVKKIIKKFL